jgi:hypothetical protein
MIDLSSIRRDYFVIKKNDPFNYEIKKVWNGSENVFCNFAIIKNLDKINNLFISLNQYSQYNWDYIPIAPNSDEKFYIPNQNTKIYLYSQDDDIKIECMTGFDLNLNSINSFSNTNKIGYISDNQINKPGIQYEGYMEEITLAGTWYSYYLVHDCRKLIFSVAPFQITPNYYYKVSFGGVFGGHRGYRALSNESIQIDNIFLKKGSLIEFYHGHVDPVRIDIVEFFDKTQIY